MKKGRVDPSKRILMEIKSRNSRKKRKSDHLNVGTKEDDDEVIPHPHDILCGRGNFVNSHEGNEFFRELVKNYKLDYVSCTKSQKKIFSLLIYNKIRERNPPGRFLKYGPRLNTWIDIGEKKALEKTRQALREGAPDILKVLSPSNTKDPFGLGMTKGPKKKKASKKIKSKLKNACVFEANKLKVKESNRNLDHHFNQGQASLKYVSEPVTKIHPLTSIQGLNHQIIDIARRRGILLHEAAQMFMDQNQILDSSLEIAMRNASLNMPDLLEDKSKAIGSVVEL